MATLLAVLPAGVPLPVTLVAENPPVLTVPDELPPSFPIIGKNNIAYFAGWFGGKFFRTHNCVASKKFELLLEGATLSE
uniref:Hypothetical secreted peptide 1498 n=1 Tax=Amblyomma variegatum TaxID=34610 RepID=F0J9W4_AMBVA|nr:TPA_inf: hypothetical secreted peptide precursor 1498 [Amblyomma variegatum]